jgi:asparagine synthase (glutamine-hydrolysing)
MSQTNESSTSSLGHEYSHCCLKNSLLSAVKRHIVSDVPYCIYLSSGIDSSLLLALASEEESKPVPSLTLSFESGNSNARDESSQAALLASQYQSQHYNCRVSNLEGSQLITKYYNAQDQPCIDGFNTWLISRYASELGFKVALSGLGADELFSGYSYYNLIPKIHTLFKSLSVIPGYRMTSGVIAPLLSALHPKLRFLPAASTDIPSLYALFRSVFSLYELSKLLPSDFIESGLKNLPSIDTHISGLFDYSLSHPLYLNAIDSTNYLLGQLLSVSDSASMAQSVELRTPFVDIRLLSEIQPFLLSRSSKYLSSKKSLCFLPKQPLPKYIYKKKKLGFSLPMSNWLKESILFDHILDLNKYTWSQSLAYYLFKQYYA